MRFSEIIQSHLITSQEFGRSRLQNRSRAKQIFCFMRENHLHEGLARNRDGFPIDPSRRFTTSCLTQVSHTATQWYAQPAALHKFLIQLHSGTRSPSWACFKCTWDKNRCRCQFTAGEVSKSG